MNSILWFIAGTAFGFYFPNVVSKIKTTVTNWFNSKSSENSDKK